MSNARRPPPPPAAAAAPDLHGLHAAVRGALPSAAGDEALRRALLHVEGVLADRIGVDRSLPPRADRRRPIR